MGLTSPGGTHRGYVSQRTCNSSITLTGILLTCLPRLTLAQLRPMLRSTTGGACCRDLESSHCPDGRLTFCSLFAGRWCLCRWRHSVNRELPDLLQHSCRCACSRSKFPIAPMGNSRFARCLQGGGVAVFGGTVTISSCTISWNTASIVRAHPQEFPMPRWESC